MRRFLVRYVTFAACWLGLLATPPLGARTVETILTEARQAEASFDSVVALERYREADTLQPDDPAILQKIATQLSDLTLLVPTPAEKKAKAEQALIYAQRCVALQPENAVNVLSLAICYGKMAVFSDTRARIEYSRLVKQYAERAIALDPTYDWAHHVLGRWQYEVANLGSATRLVVRLVYGGLPAATNADAIASLERAVALAPNRVPHHLELGFAYLADERSTDARASFERGLALPSIERYDEAAKVRARKALEKL